MIIWLSYYNHTENKIYFLFSFRLESFCFYGILIQRKGYVMDTIFTGLDQDIRDNLKQQLFVYWTYSSNAIEGNSLTLGETDFIIREGLTIAGKPLQDHKDAEAHYNAVKLTYRMLSADALTEFPTVTFVLPI